MARWAKEERVQRGGNSNNPEVFSRSPPGQRGSQDTAKTVRVLCSIHPIAQTPFSFSVSPFLRLPLYPSIGICFYLLVPRFTLFHPRMYRGVLSYGLDLPVVLEPCVRCAQVCPYRVISRKASLRSQVDASEFTKPPSVLSKSSTGLTTGLFRLIFCATLATIDRYVPPMKICRTLTRLC